MEDESVLAGSGPLCDVCSEVRDERRGKGDFSSSGVGLWRAELMCSVLELEDLTTGGDGWARVGQVDVDASECKEFAESQT